MNGCMTYNNIIIASHSLVVLCYIIIKPQISSDVLALVTWQAKRSQWALLQIVRSKVDIALFIGKFAIAIATALGISLTSIKMTSMCSAWSEQKEPLFQHKATEVFFNQSSFSMTQRLEVLVRLSVLEAIPGLSEKVNSCFTPWQKTFLATTMQGDCW